MDVHTVKGHELRGVGKITHRSHFVASANGGQVNRPVPIDTPYFRAYCACGSVTGRASRATDAKAAHVRHAESMKGGA